VSLENKFKCERMKERRDWTFLQAKYTPHDVVYFEVHVISGFFKGI
jgi:hypothetical protein